MIRSKPYERRRADRRESPTSTATPIETLAADLPRAMAADEIAVVFQPQVRIVDARITGVEALARWDHPSAGALGADVLFAAAGRGGLEVALSDHIQARALRLAAAWRGTPASLDLSINVTAQDLARADFPRRLLDRVGASGFPADRLTLEVTETAEIEDLTAAAIALEQVRGAGVRVAIDDFGTGYASFAYVRALPLDRLKIDRSLVEGIDRSRKDLAVVSGVIALAEALELDVIAEGVERVGQRDRLAEQGCGWYQGFLCAGGLGADALAELVEGRS